MHASEELLDSENRPFFAHDSPTTNYGKWMEGALSGSLLLVENFSSFSGIFRQKRNKKDKKLA